MVRLNKVYVLFSFVLFLLLIEVAYSTEQVVIEFLYWDPSKDPHWSPGCPSCVYEYEQFLGKNDTMNRIQASYRGRVLVYWTEYYSSDGQSKGQLYNIDRPNSLAIKDWKGDFKIVQGVFNETYETYVREVIDGYLRRDVAVLSVVPSSYSVSAGEFLEINVTVKNRGNYVEFFNVTVCYDSNIIETFLVEGLEPGGEEILVFHWDTKEVTVGNYTLSAYAHPVQDETNTDDNLYHAGVIEVRAPDTLPSIRHDIAIISVIPSKLVVDIGEKVNTTATMKNVGTKIESFNVSAYYNASLIESWTVASLSPGNEFSKVFVWDTSNATSGNYIIKVQSEPVEGETNLIDNERTCTIKVSASSQASTSFTLAVLIGAFSFGFLETFSPCLIALLSFLLSYTMEKTTKFKEGLFQVMLFAAGFVSAAILLGLTVGLAFFSFEPYYNILFWTVCVLAIFFGLNLLGLNFLRFLNIDFNTKPLVKRLARKYAFTYSGLVLLGFLFYFLDPCLAPIFVSSLLTFSNAPSGYLPIALLVFGLGVIIPFISIGILAGSISELARSTYRYRSKIRAVSGLILIAYAIYLIVKMIIGGI